MPLFAINHHYYRNISTGRGIYPTTPEVLASKVSEVGELWDFVAEDDVISYCWDELREDRNICVLTFDDGLKEQIRAVHDLYKKGIKAICFVSTAPIVENVMLDVHKLHMIRSSQTDEELAAILDKKFGIWSYRFDDELLAAQYRYDSDISRKVKYYINFVLEKSVKDTWISDLFKEKHGSEKNACEQLYMNIDDIQFLAKHKILGTHSHQHLPLATLSNVEIENEILRSIDILEDISGGKIKGISYPYGGKSAVNEKLFSIAEQCGLQYGFTMERGINTKSSDNSLSLKRIDTNDYMQWYELGRSFMR